MTFVWCPRPAPAMPATSAAHSSASGAGHPSCRAAAPRPGQAWTGGAGGGRLRHRRRLRGRTAKRKRSPRQAWQLCRLVRSVVLQSKTPREFVKTFALHGNLFKPSFVHDARIGRPARLSAPRQSFPDCTLLPFPSHERVTIPQCQVQTSNQLSAGTLACIRCRCESCTGSTPRRFSS